MPDMPLPLSGNRSSALHPSCTCRSPLSSPRLRTRSRTEGHDPFPVAHDPRQGRDVASGEISSSTAVDSAVPYSSASAAAGAAGAVAAASVATGVASSTAGEPVKRQKGRFKLRDLGEIQSGPPTPVAGGLGGSGSVGGAGGVAGGQGQPSQQSQMPAQLSGTLSDVSLSTAGEQQPTGVAVAPGAGTAAAAAAPVTAAPLDVQASIILLMEQNRQILDKLATIVPETPAPSTSAAAATAPTSTAQTQATVATATAAAAVSVESRYQFVSNSNPPPGVDRSRTSSMTALTLQAPLPPKPPNLYGAGSSGDRNVSPLTRDAPSGWWGSQPVQGQQGPGGGGAQGSAGGGAPQGQGGQPPRRPVSAGGSGGGMSGAGGGGGSGGGGAGGSTSTSSARAKDDGTGRRAERGRLSTLIDQLKDEIDFHATAKRDMDLELKRVSFSCVLGLCSFDQRIIHD